LRFGYLNLEFIYNLVLVICYFRIIRIWTVRAETGSRFLAQQIKNPKLLEVKKCLEN